MLGFIQWFRIMAAIKSMNKLLICFSLLFLSACQPRVVPDPTYELLVQVRDAGNRGVAGATVTLFLSQEDFLANTNAVATQKSDNGGLAVFSDLNKDVFIYVISAELQKANNWGISMTYGFQDIAKPVQNYEAKISEIRFADILSGRGNLRWNQLYTQINGNRSTACGQRFELNFGRQLILTYYVPRGCPAAGAQASATGWAPSLDGSSLIIGQPNSTRNQRRMNILELTDTRLRLMEQLVNATIVEEYELVQ